MARRIVVVENGEREIKISIPKYTYPAKIGIIFESQSKTPLSVEKMTEACTAVMEQIVDAKTKIKVGEGKNGVVVVGTLELQTDYEYEHIGSLYRLFAFRLVFQKEDTRTVSFFMTENREFLGKGSGLITESWLSPFNLEFSVLPEIVEQYMLDYEFTKKERKVF